MKTKQNKNLSLRNKEENAALDLSFIKTVHHKSYVTRSTPLSPIIVAEPQNKVVHHSSFSQFMKIQLNGKIKEYHISSEIICQTTLYLDASNLSVFLIGTLYVIEVLAAPNMIHINEIIKIKIWITLTL